MQILMKTYEIRENGRKLKVVYLQITCMSTTNYCRLQKLVPSKN